MNKIYTIEIMSTESGDFDTELILFCDGEYITSEQIMENNSNMEEVTENWKKEYKFEKYNIIN
jgi:hypothetical protein